MRVLLITSLCCFFTLTGCKLHPIVLSQTPQISARDLAIKHIYRTPKQSKNHSTLTRFHDPQLIRLVAIALQDAPDISIAKARVEKANQLSKRAYSALWPTAGISGFGASQYFDLQGEVPPLFNQLLFSRLNNAAANLKANYELDLWGKNRENLATQVNQTFAAQMDLEETRLMISAAVASAYFELQNTMTQRQLAQENVRLQSDLERIVLDRAKQGIISDTPVKTAISNTQKARLAVEEYKHAEMQSRNQLAVLMGKNPFNTHIETMRFTYQKQQVALPAVIPANVLARRPDINAARAMAEAAAHQINVARTAFFPNINLSGLLSAQYLYFSQFFNLHFPLEGVKAAVDLPIFDIGARRANLGAKKAEFEMAISQYNKTLLNALREVTDDLSALHTLNKQISDQNKALRATENNYTLFRARYARGIIDYVQLIEIKQVVLQQKSTLYMLQARQKQALVALLAALGGEVNL